MALSLPACRDGKGFWTDEEMWNIVHYIRHLPAKGSLGAPPIFKEEAEEHEHMTRHGRSLTTKTQNRIHHKH